ncbi:MAG: hypothetical protein L0Z50_38505 [Verrucomicrobiales bacterium]|nr:hypothetical protein [Verrucomicrobiales bacterium]
MNEIFASLLAILIAIYGLLYIIGGPCLANRLPQGLSLRLKLMLRRLFRELLALLCAVTVSAIRFVFYRPRR